MTDKPFAITLDVGSSLVNHTGSWRSERPVYVDLLPPCNQACPAGENIQAWLFHAESGDYEAALDILEELIDSGRAGAKPSNFSSLSVFRWWLQFEGVRVEALRDNPRYKVILDRHAAKLAKEREAILALMQ